MPIDYIEASRKEIEYWKPIDGYPNYEISNLGRVASRTHILNSDRGTGAKKYHRVCLYNLRKGRNFSVHTLVLEAFVSAKPLGLIGRHLDDDIENNRLYNLAWGTHSDNQADSVRNGTARRCRGNAHWNSKLDPDKVRDIRHRLLDKQKQVDIAALHGVAQSVISRINTGTLWSEGGYIAD